MEMFIVLICFLLPFHFVQPGAVDNVIFRLETSLVAAGGHEKLGKHAFVLHTCDSQV